MDNFSRVVMARQPCCFRCGILFCISLAFACGAAAQDVLPGKHLLGSGIGIGWEANRDELASPLRYQGAVAQVWLDYRYRGSRNHYRLAAMGGGSRFSSSITSGSLHRQQGGFLQVQGGYGRKIAGSSEAKSRLFAGFLSDNFYHYREHQLMPSATEYVGIFYTSLNAALLGSRRMGKKGEATLRLSLPALAYVVRPPYSLRGYWQGRFSTIDSFFALDATLAYERELSSRLALRTALAFSHYRAQEPFPARAVQYLFTMGLLLKR